ncbi:unnamed protein product [Ectocarpus sp. CCAP 1310/34]|nr:unnamed protein product [Ectocarpus sp. CCAP 1310/34]
MEARRNVRPLTALAVSLLSLSSYQPVLVGADDTINGVVSGAFDFAGQQLTVLKEDVLVDNDVFTSYTDEDGQVCECHNTSRRQELISHTTATCGASRLITLCGFVVSHAIRYPPPSLFSATCYALFSE